MKDGAHANLDGYLINFDFYDECNAIDLSSPGAMPASTRILVVQVAQDMKQKDREELRKLISNRPRSDFLKLEEPPFWREIKPFTSRTDELVDKTLDWWE